MISVLVPYRWQSKAGGDARPRTAAATTNIQVHSSHLFGTRSTGRSCRLHKHRIRSPTVRPGPYNPVASLPQKVVKKCLTLSLSKCPSCGVTSGWMTQHLLTTHRTTTKSPVINIRVWLECYARIAALLISHFPQKGPELWAYQSTVLKAVYNYEGSN